MNSLNEEFAYQELSLLVPHVLFFEDDGATPNSRFPVLVYELAINPDMDVAAAFERLFESNEWSPL